ncbi:MAG: translation initiation factor IF-2 [Candidatus Kerfeldbacteria bacterium]|nr:translation initiation factor IF-2 [Candidatus Kerfeldbacteria bacterium]
MNVTELYRELKMTKEEFFTLVQELGFDIGERAIKIDDRVAVKIIDAIKQKRKLAGKRSIFATDEPPTPEETATDAATKRILKIPEKITVKEFADVVQKRVADLIAILMRNGIMATINETLDFETAAIIAEDMGFKPELGVREEDVNKPEDRSHLITESLEREDAEKLLPRPPVVVIMGHVDHGKTTLLDTIRQTNVVAKESGGITQHIGAYQVIRNEKLITFIDTPGHEAFTTMRSRGARVADIAILVVAADDGIKPQTIESIHIMEEAKLPFIVAINKIDKPGADIDRVKKELSELNLIPEDYGGKTICVPVSAMQNKHIDELLDTLLLLAEMEKENIVANPKGETVGTIIESHVDKHTGPVATVLVQNGTLRIGDIILIGNVPGRVRSMKNWQGREVKQADASMPVQVLGLKKSPVVGDVLQVVKDKKILKQHVKAYDSFSFLRTQKKDRHEEKNSLPIILRADKLGSLEAIIQSLHGITHEEVRVEIIQKGLGNVTENDIALARSSGAFVIGFHVSATPGAEKFARDEQVEIKQFEIIYELIDAVKDGLQKLLSKAVTYERIGSLRVLAVFKTGTNHIIVGGRVEDGVMKNHAPVKIVRKGQMVAEGTIGQLQKEKKNAGEVTSGSECGLRIDGTPNVQTGDTIEAYEAQEKERTLE